MKRSIVLLGLLLCMGLWGCEKAEAPVEETAVVPPQSQPATESTQAVEPEEKVETYYDENGDQIVVSINSDGSRTETRNYADGGMVSIYDNPSTGEHVEMEFSKDWVRIREKSYNPAADRYSEVEFYENGKEKRASIRESSTGFTSEQEYYENGNRKYIKTRDPETGREIHYNEEGYCTYSCSENYRDDGSVYYKRECFGDETGRLMKVTENGEEKTDANFLADCANEFNFRQ